MFDPGHLAGAGLIGGLIAMIVTFVLTGRGHYKSFDHTLQVALGTQFATAIVAYVLLEIFG